MIFKKGKNMYLNGFWRSNQMKSNLLNKKNLGLFIGIQEKIFHPSRYPSKNESLPEEEQQQTSNLGETQNLFMESLEEFKNFYGDAFAILEKKFPYINDKKLSLKERNLKLFKDAHESSFTPEEGGEDTKMACYLCLHQLELMHWSLTSEKSVNTFHLCSLLWFYGWCRLPMVLEEQNESAIALLELACFAYGFLESDIFNKNSINDKIRYGNKYLEGVSSISEKIAKMAVFSSQEKQEKFFDFLAYNCIYQSLMNIEIFFQKTDIVSEKTLFLTLMIENWNFVPSTLEEFEDKVQKLLNDKNEEE